MSSAMVRSFSTSQLRLDEWKRHLPRTCRRSLSVLYSLFKTASTWRNFLFRKCMSVCLYPRILRKAAANVTLILLCLFHWTAPKFGRCWPSPSSRPVVSICFDCVLRRIMVHSMITRDGRMMDSQTVALCQKDMWRWRRAQRKKKLQKVGCQSGICTSSGIWTVCAAVTPSDEVDEVETANSQVHPV